MKSSIPNNGDTIWINGYEFTVSDVRILDRPDGVQIVRFIGTCTDARENDSIRNTAYNGGRYGWRIN